MTRPSESQMRLPEAATWGPRQNPEPSDVRLHTIALVAWPPRRPLVKGAPRGFATVLLPNGLQIADVAIFETCGKAWASPPSKPVVGKDGQLKIGPNGRPDYTVIPQWKNRELVDGFSAAVVDAVRAAYPEALDGAEP
jgi:hypothetical protein